MGANEKWAEKLFRIPEKDLPFLDQLMAERGIGLEQAIDDYLAMYGNDKNPTPIRMSGQSAVDDLAARRIGNNVSHASYPQESLTDPHRHILARLHENTTTAGLAPTNAFNKGGLSTDLAITAKKEGDEFAPTGEEKREVSLGKKILAAAGKLAKTPDVEDIMRAADELVKMHGKS